MRMTFAGEMVSVVMANGLALDAVVIFAFPCAHSVVLSIGALAKKEIMIDMVTSKIASRMSPFQYG